jgi:hypothetical protein
MKDEQSIEHPSQAAAAGSAPSSPAEKHAAPSADQPGEASQLTPEEQMARFEEDLKEHDWGHQPC